MRRFLPNWIIPAVLALCCCGPAAADDADGKDLHPYKNSGGAPAAQLASSDPSAEKVEKPASPLAYAVAVLSAVVVLSIICVPSRKPESSTSR